MQVERVLEDLIQRLTDREKTPEVRAALIEARRLKNVTTRWAAIPPPPDARREMLTRVMELVSSVGSPISFSSPPPPSAPSSGPTSQRPDSSPGPLSRRGAMAHAPTEAAMSPVDEVLSPPPRRPPTPPAPLRDLKKRTTGGFGFGRQLAPVQAPRTPASLGSDDFESQPRAGTLTGFESAKADGKPPSSNRKSAFPTAPPPALGGSLGAPPGASSSGRHAATAPPPAPSAPRASGGFGEGRGRTLAQGSLEISDALDALVGVEAPALPRIDDPPTEQEPAVARRAETREMPHQHEPASKQPTLASTPSPPAVRAIAAASDGKVEGFSKTVSMTGIPAVRAATPKVPTIGPTTTTARPSSNPTQTLFGAGIQQALKDAQTKTPPPPSARRPGSVPPGMRTLIAPGVTIVRPDAVEWQSHPSASGVTMKTLYRDPRVGIYTALMRFAPGASLGRRRHASPAELYLVSGTAFVGDHEMHAGEYARAESETVTDAIRSPTGCTFFVCGSENDELLDDA
jgi:hypothetical protein